jgi:hypothetical protein
MRRAVKSPTSGARNNCRNVPNMLSAKIIANQTINALTKYINSSKFDCFDFFYGKSYSPITFDVSLNFRFRFTLRKISTLIIAF